MLKERIDAKKRPYESGGTTPTQYVYVSPQKQLSSTQAATTPPQGYQMPYMAYSQAPRATANGAVPKTGAVMNLAMQQQRYMSLLQLQQAQLQQAQLQQAQLHQQQQLSYVPQLYATSNGSAVRQQARAIPVQQPSASSSASQIANEQPTVAQPQPQVSVDSTSAKDQA